MNGLKIPSTRAIGRIRRTWYRPVYLWKMSLKVSLIDRMGDFDFYSILQPTCGIYHAKNIARTYLAGSWAVWASRNTPGNIYGRSCEVIKTLHRGLWQYSIFRDISQIKCVCKHCVATRRSFFHWIIGRWQKTSKCQPAEIAEQGEGQKENKGWSYKHDKYLLNQSLI